MPTKKELYFVAESSLEFGMNGDIPLSSKKTNRRARGKKLGHYVGTPEGGLKLIINRK